MGRLFDVYELVQSGGSLGRGRRRELALHDAEMELLNEVQQFGAHTGSHKRAAVLASRFCQPGVLAIEAPSEYPIIATHFGSTGSVHGIPPNLEA